MSTTSSCSPSGYDWTLDKLRVARLIRERGNAAFQKQKYQAAIEDYNMSLKVLPPLKETDPVHTAAVKEALVFALVNRAFCQSKQKKWHNSMLDCTRVLEWDPGCEKALFRRAKALHALNRNQQSLQDLLKLQALSPSKHNAAAHKLMVRVQERFTFQRLYSPLQSMPLPSPPPPSPPPPSPPPKACLLETIANNALFVVAEYLTPLELGTVAGCCSTFMQQVCGSNYIWQCLYTSRFGALYPATNMKQQTWQATYKMFLFGESHMTVQVINRETERNLEFTMSAYDAKASYRLELNAWHVTYLNDDRGVVCETVPTKQLRPIPTDLGSATTPYSPWKLYRHPAVATAAAVKTQKIYAVGDGVEIQWKRQKQHPYGWWYGVISDIWHGDTEETTGKVGEIVHVQLPGRNAATYACIVPEEDQDAGAGAAATLKARKEECTTKFTKITVVFEQYVQDSPWRSVTVVMNAKNAIRSLGGWVGGIRKSTTAKQVWKGFLPGRKIR